MPILRYFLFVGGTLLGLLILADAVLPSAPLPASLSSASDLPAVRIQSARKWPERIVMDTSVVTPAPARIASLEQSAPTAAATARSGAREAFAQMTMVDTKPQPPSAMIAEKPRASAVKSVEAAKAVESKKRKIARARPGRPMILVAQQPHFGFFDTTW